jgi:hypothetical protein
MPGISTKHQPICNGGLSALLVHFAVIWIPEQSKIANPKSNGA